MTADGICHHAPNDKIIIGGDADGGEFFVCRNQQDGFFLNLDIFNREFPIDKAHGNLARFRVQRFVHHDQVPIINPRINHAVATDAPQKS